MTYNIGTDEDPIYVLVRFSNGMLDAIVRATDKATFEAAALWAGLRYEVQETITDPETGETTTQGTGEIKTARGVNLDHLGPVIITPGTYDEEGNELTAPVVDNRHHVNIRIAEPALSLRDKYGVLVWEKWAMAWSIGGNPDPQINAHEEAVVLEGVSLIDPDSISTPTRVWA